ncbi:MAG TPA: glycosyltransferase [Planococcus sp. (in: firmicutes)]|nr:glycosyltransferase [Planococcus sp. (in: firmicutes)]
MQNDLISVIMSTYNEKLDWVEKSVESILNQTYKKIEFIVIVDNPEQLTLIEMLRKYEKEDARIRLIINETNQGLVRSLNLALRYCRGKYIARMDADDISSLQRLELQKAYLEEQELDFVFSGVKVIDEASVVQYEMNGLASNAEETKRKLEMLNMSCHSTWLLKSEIYNQLGGYREINYCEDYDFLLRCLAKGLKIGQMDGDHVMYRVRQDGISRSHSLEQFLNAKAILKLYKNHHLEDGLDLVTLQGESDGLATEKEKNRFSKAGKYYLEGITLVRNGNRVQGVCSLMKSNSISKYYLSRNIDVLKYKIANRRPGYKAYKSKFHTSRFLKLT